VQAVGGFAQRNISKVVLGPEYKALLAACVAEHQTTPYKFGTHD
jgi:hypothetical protein